MKTRGDFHFKKFSVSHDRSTHKVGTDAVLLGAWVNVDGAEKILDIGTGSGVIALMLAQRTSASAQIDAVEIQHDDVQQAMENIKMSPWPDKVRVHHSSVQQFESESRYDLIVSNPPFFIDSYLPPAANRSLARHTNDLTFPDLLSAVVRLLQPKGRFAIVLPVVEAGIFKAMAEERGLKAVRELIFKARPEKPPERLLIEFSYQPIYLQREELVLYAADQSWSDEYWLLTNQFYLRRMI